MVDSDDELRQWLKKMITRIAAKRKCVSQTHRFQCAWISVVCASDLLPATQGHPDSQTSLNYSRVPMQKEQNSRYQTGNTYRNWLDYFSHSSTAAHSTWRLLIGWVAWKPGSPHPSNECVRACVSSCAQIVLQNRVSVNNHCLLFVKERQWETKTNRRADRGIESATDIQTNCPVLDSWGAENNPNKKRHMSLSPSLLLQRRATSHSLSTTPRHNLDSLTQSKPRQCWKHISINM